MEKKVDLAQLDVTKTNLAIERLLEVTENPRHRFLLQNYYRHRYLEIALGQTVPDTRTYCPILRAGARRWPVRVTMENPFSYFQFGNLLIIDLIAARTNALNGALLARSPSHYRGNYWTIVGILALAIFGGIVVRDVMLAQVSVALSNPWYLYVCLIAGIIGISVAYNRGQQFRDRPFQLPSS